MLQVWYPWLWQVCEGGATSCSSLHWPWGHLCSSCLSTLICAVYNCTDWGQVMYPYTESHVHIYGHVCTYTLIILSQDLASAFFLAPLPKQCLLSMFYSCITASPNADHVQAFGFKPHLVKQLLPRAVPSPLESLKIHMELHF